MVHVLNNSKDKAKSLDNFQSIIITTEKLSHMPNCSGSPMPNITIPQNNGVQSLLESLDISIWP